MCMLGMALSQSVYAQLPSTITVPSTDYPSIKVAVDSLNLYGVTPGGVTVNVAADWAEVAPGGGIRLTASGTAGNPIVIQKDLTTTGENPIITAYSGTSTTLDGIFFLLGSDYVTIDGIDLKDTAANSTNLLRMEFGYALLNGASTVPYNGCQYNTIKNATITLERLNPVSRAIYSAHHIVTATTLVSLNGYTLADCHSYNKFQDNVITNAFTGIYLLGLDDNVAPYTRRDYGNEVTNDSIYGLGLGGSAEATTSAGVLMSHQYGPKVSGNYINNIMNGASVPGNGVYGIYMSSSNGTHPGFAEPDAECKNNTVIITLPSASSSSYGIYVRNYTGNLTVDDNDVKFANGPSTSPGIALGINVLSSGTVGPVPGSVLSFQGNKAQDFSFAGSGTTTIFQLQAIAQTTLNVGNNTISNITRTGGASNTFVGILMQNSPVLPSYPGAVANVFGNTVQGVTLSNSSSGIAAAIRFGGVTTTNIYNNTVDGIISTSTGTGFEFFGIQSGFNNGINFYVYNNTVSNIVMERNIYGFYHDNTGTNSSNLSIYQNQVFNLTSSANGSFAVHGIGLQKVAADLTKVHNNKIYNLSQRGSGTSSVYGIYVLNPAQGATYSCPLYIDNNLISAFDAPASTNTLQPSIAGVYLGYSSANAPVAATLRHNTIYFTQATDTVGANTNTATVYAHVSRTMKLNNNIFYNDIHQAAGTGVSSGLMLSGGSVANYNTASGNNLWYNGTPSSQRLFCYDGTNKDSTWVSFKNRVAPREALSLTQNITMLPASPTDPFYLQVDSSAASSIESTGLVISEGPSLATDVRGVIRQGYPGYTGSGTKPDIGAYESQGSAIAMTYDSNLVISATSGALKGAPNQIIANIQVYVSGTDASKTATLFDLNTGFTGFVSDIVRAKVYYTASSQVFDATTQFGSSVNSPNGQFYVNGSQNLINGVNHFWVVYDIAPTAVGGNPLEVLVNGVTVSSSALPPTGNNLGSVLVVEPLSSTITVGTFDYPTLQSVIDRLNAAGISGPTTVQLTAGYIEYAQEGGYRLGSKTLNATLNATNTLSFVKTGGPGPNPVLKSSFGSGAFDGIFTLSGTDYVTIDGIDLEDTSTVNNATAQMEWGYGLLKLNAEAPFDGCSNNTIQNCTVTLRRTNTASKGIYADAYTINDNSALLPLATAEDANNNNRFVSNTLTDLNTGIYMRGFSNSSQTIPDVSLFDNGNVIGDSLQPNTVTNFAGAAAGFGIQVLNQHNVKIRFNEIDNYAGGAVAASVAGMGGILNSYNSTGIANPTNAEISYNSVNLTAAQGASISFTNIATQYTHGNAVLNYNSVKWATLGTGVSNGTFIGIDFNNGGAASLASSLSFVGNVARDFTFQHSAGGTPVIFRIAGAAATEDIGYDSIYNVTRLNGGTGLFALFSAVTISNPVRITSETQTRNIHHNYIHNVSSGNLATGTFAAITAGYAYNLNIYNNTIDTLSHGGNQSSPSYGIIVASTSVNRIINIYNNSIDSFTTLASGISGIYVESTGTPNPLEINVYDNTVTRLCGKPTSVTFANMLGIAVTYGQNINIYRNKVSGITHAGTTGGYAAGILTNQPASVGSFTIHNYAPLNIYNNIVSDIFAPTAAVLTANPAVMGIAIGGVASVISTFYTANVYYNTVSLSGTTVANLNSAGIYCDASQVLTLANNIVINNITPSGTGVASAFHRKTPSLVTHDAQSNNNLLWAGSTPSSTHLIYFDGTNRDSTLTQFKARMYPRESQSVTEDVLFISTDPTDPFFLYPDSVSPTVLETGGMPIAGYTTDYLNTTRPATPDIGAYEGNFTIEDDLIPPTVNVTPVVNNPVTGVLTVTASISDPSGVDTVAFTPKIYYKKNSAIAYFPSNGTKVSGTGLSGDWNFTIDASNVDGGVIAVGDTISYYIVAQDMATPLSNVGSGPFGVEASDVYFITTEPTPFSYVVLPALSGVIEVCDLCACNSLTNEYGAFDSINKSGLTGNVILKITGDLTTETGAITLKQFNQVGDYNVSIVPDAASERLIAGTATGISGLIHFDGADNVLIDGRYAGSGMYLRFRNKGLNGATFRFGNDAQHDTIRYVYIEGFSNANPGATVYFSAPLPGGTGNDYNAVMNCEVRDTLGNQDAFATDSYRIPNTAFYSDARLNSHNNISDNKVFNFIYQGVNIPANMAGADFWTISGNSFYQTSAGAAKAGNNTGGASQAISILSGQGHTITNNSIGGSAPDRSGAAYRVINTASGGSIQFTGITYAASPAQIGNDYATTISGNIISNIDANPTGLDNSFAGILVGAGTVNILNNTIGGGAMPYDTIKEGSGAQTNAGGIVLVGGTVTVTGNDVGNISNYMARIGTAGIRTIGINVIGGALGSPMNFTLNNNTVHDIRSNYVPVAQPLYMANIASPVGIWVQPAATVPVTVSGNTVHNIVNTQTMGSATSAFGIVIRGGTCTIERNRIYNIQTEAQGAGADASKIYGLYINGTTTGAASQFGQTVRNNQISLSTASSSEASVYGIMDATAQSFTSHNYSNNSIAIGGTATGSNNTYAMVVGNANSATVSNMFNNVLYNGRTGGSGKHVAIGSLYISQLTPFIFNYNMMVGSDASGYIEMPLGNYYNAADVNSFYASRPNANWMDVSGNVSSGSLFTNAASGDLGINTANAACWYVNGKGLPMASVTNDFNGASRSTTITGGSTDIGAVEFTTATVPPSAVPSAAPANNGTTNYTFAGRTVASIAWGAGGSVPSSVDVKYYTGEYAPSLISGRSRFNSYYEVTPSGGTGYTYQMSLSYDSAMFGDVSATGNVRIAYNTTAWDLLASSSGNGITGMMSTNGPLGASTLPAVFTGTDNSNNPLPVRMLSFAGRLSGEDVELKWQTATEENANGYVVERSYDGRNFDRIGFVKANGTTGKVSRYGYMDYNMKSAVAYYRLKQLDNDGAYTYSDVVRVSRESRATNSASVYPNPFTSQFRTEFASQINGQAQIEILDLQGRVVRSQATAVVNGLNTVELSSCESLETGVYFLRISVGGESQVVKLIKQ